MSFRLNRHHYGEPDFPVIPPNARTPLPAVGTVFQLPRRLETFSGFQIGEATITAAYYDHYGECLVNFSRAGRAVACAVAWPMEETDVSSVPVGSDPVHCDAAFGDDRQPASSPGEEQGRTGVAAVHHDSDERRSPSDDLDSATDADATDPNGGMLPPLQGGTSYRAGSGSGEGDQPLHFGLVVVVDLLNVLVRAWHAGTPSKVHAVKSMLLTCANIIERLSPEYLLFAADGGHNDRTALYPEYKAHRPPKPEGMQEQIDLAEAALEAIGWPVIRVVGWEADDVAASLATRIAPVAAGVVIASSDKDLLQLVGSQAVKIYHPWDKGQFFGPKAVEEKFHVRPDQIADYLAMCGDTSDGVPGVKGVGPKSAAELLGKHGTLETILEEARLQRIIGAAGKALRERAADARLSRQLVELRRDIPIYAKDWKDWPAVEPRAGWVSALRSLDLGMVVQRLMEILPTAGRSRTGTAAVSFEWEHSTISDFGTASPAVTLIPIEPAQEPSPDMASLDPKAVAPPKRNCIEEMEQQSLERALATDFSDPDWVRGFPVPRDFGPGAPRELILRSIYATTWLSWEKRSGEPFQSDWRYGTDSRAVAELAYHRLPFSMPKQSPLPKPLVSEPTSDSPELASPAGI